MNNKVYLTNFIWRLMERFGAQGVTLLVSIVLARLLNPDVYGIISLVTVITVILNIFVDGGFGNALIQKKDADDVDFSTIFFFNIAFSLFLYIVLFISAPYISMFYGIQQMTTIIRVMGIVIVISGIKNIQQAYVSKNMLFKKFFFSTLTGTIMAALVGILLAYKGFGVWSIVIQNLVNQFVDTFILWLTVGWRPKWSFSFKRLAILFNYGWKLLISNLVYNSFVELRQLLIGKVYSATDLAYYNQGEKFPNMINNNINTSIDSILFPAMSKSQENIDDIKKMLKRSIQLSQFLVAPCVLGLAASAEQVVSIVLTEKWLPCVPYMQMFCIANVFGFMGNANQNAILAIGRSDIKLKIEIVKTIMDLIILFITVPFGPIYIALGYAASSILRIIICAYPNKKLLNYSFVMQLVDISKCLLINFLMAGLVYCVGFLEYNNVVTFLIQVFIGGIFYILLSYLAKLEPFLYIINILKNRRKND